MSLHLQAHLSIGALSQHFEQLELGGVRLLTSLLNVVADVDLLQYAVILRQRREELSCTQLTRDRHGCVCAGRMGGGRWQSGTRTP